MIGVCDMKGVTKDLKPLIKAAERQGWRVDLSKNNHVKFLAPSGAMVIAGVSISDHRGLKNVQSHLRKAGLAV